MSAKYLLDTDICIYFIRHREPRVVRRVAAHAHHSTISAITLGELQFGRAGSSNPAAVQPAIELLLESFPVAPITADVAEPYGRIRAALRARGTPIGANGLWIAAQALAANLILVTNNEKEFRRVPGLKIQNWAR